MQQQTTVTNAIVPPLYIPAWLGQTFNHRNKRIILG
jgi:hypothetical protein